VPYSLRAWVQLPSQFTLAAKETKTLSIPIVVPASGEPGGHYGVIRFTGAVPGASGSVVSLSQASDLDLATSFGHIQERASLDDFYSTTPQFAPKSFFQNGPIAS